MQLELRRHENTLIVMGMGIIVLGFWSTIKMGISMFISGNDDFSVIGESDPVVIAGKIIGVLLVTVLDLFIRYRVGRAAISEGKGARKGTLYILYALLMEPVSLGFIALSVWAAYKGMAELSDVIVAIVTELTAAVIYFELVYAALRTRMLRRRIYRLQGNKNAA